MTPEQYRHTLEPPVLECENPIERLAVRAIGGRASSVRSGRAFRESRGEASRSIAAEARELAQRIDMLVVRGDVKTRGASPSVRSSLKVAAMAARDATGRIDRIAATPSVTQEAIAVCRQIEATIPLQDKDIFR